MQQSDTNNSAATNKPIGGWRRRLHTVIFEADTFGGKLFDVALIVSILMSVLVVMLSSVESIAEQHGRLLHIAEWVFTILFTAEYILRILCIGRPLRYVRSFFGVVDLLAILPTYLEPFIVGARFVQVVRILRVLRIFRVLKLTQYVGEARMLGRALLASRRRIIVFMLTVVTLTVIFGSIMYLVEGGQNGFTSIPRSVYWAIVTLTTVGYGDISPATALGQAIAAAVMILGYSILAIPTGMVTVEMNRLARQPDTSLSTQACPQCASEGHDTDAVFCKYCGARM